MGSGISVGNKPTAARRGSSGKDAVETSEDFEARAKHLASEFRDLRLGTAISDVGGERQFTPAPSLEQESASLRSLRSQSLQSSPYAVPRAERMTRWSPHLPDRAFEQNEGVQVTQAAATSSTDGGSGRIDNVQDGESHNTELPTDAGVDSNVRGGKVKDARESEEKQFVHRDEMVGLARALGYEITLEQGMRMFDMLDSQQQGRILKADLFRLFLPLLQRVGRSDPPEKGATGRRPSPNGSPPRRPRPSSPCPLGIKTPPRPAGTPPPTAKRRVTTPFPGGLARAPSPGLTPLNPALPLSLEESKKSIVVLKAVSSLDHLKERPSKFWLKLRPGEDGVTPVTPLLTPLSNEVGPADVRRLRHGLNAEQIHKRGEEQATGETRMNVDVGAGDGRGELHVANSVSVGNKDAYGSKDGGTDGVNGKNEADASAVIEAGSESRQCGMTTNSDPAAVDLLARKRVLDWTAADVLTWIRALPRGLAAFADAQAFAKGSVDGKKLAKLTLSDIKRKEFHHAKFEAKIPTALWVEIKQIQSTVPAPAATASPAPQAPAGRFSPGQTIVDEASKTPLCTVKHFIGQGAFGEVYKVIWTGIGADWGATLAMKTVRLADISSGERDEYRVLLMEEILTAVRVKSHPNVVNVRFAHIMGFCSDSEEYFCFEDFVTGTDLEALVAEGEGRLYDGSPAEIQGRLLSYSIQLARGLGHIHRCGVLHQDIKSANIMVSSDAGILITDFGFAAVGHFGPQRSSMEESASASTDKFRPAAGTPTAMNGVSQLTGERSTGTHPHSGAVAPVDSPSGTVDSRNDGKISRMSPEWDHIRGQSVRFLTTATLAGCDYSAPAMGRHSGAQGDEITPAEASQQVDGTACGSVPAAVKAHHSCSTATVEVAPASVEVAPASPEKKEQLTTITESTGTLSPLIEVPRNRDENGPTSKVGAQEDWRTSKLTEGGAGKPLNRKRVLYGTLKGYTPRYRSPEVGVIVGRKRKVAAIGIAEADRRPSQRKGLQDPSLSRTSTNHCVVNAPHTHFTHRSDMWAAGVVVLEMYAGGLNALPAGRGEHALALLETLARNADGLATPTANGGHPAIEASQRQLQGGHEIGEVARSGAAREDEGSPPPGAVRGAGLGTTRGRSDTKKLDTFRVEMPEGVLAVLREIFQQKVGDRPESMEVLAARLSRILASMLEKRLAVVPRPSTGAPSSASLCEESPADIDCDDNHAKVGRLHMWLGKALFLKGADRREQALQEYREGVRVLAESKADRRSPSMALFRWYLGKALLETGEIDEALPHLKEAVSIDPESAKYRHTLGLAKCATGDDVGAREDLLEAALLDEEDAEYRYQLRMQRIREKQRKAEEHKEHLRQQLESEKAACATQGASSPKADDAEPRKLLKAVTTSWQNEPSDPTSSLSRAHLLALERASVSTRTYALDELGDYRTGRGVGRGGEFRRGATSAMDTGGICFGDKSLRNAAALREEARRFSVGEKIVCGAHSVSPSNNSEPLRCSRPRPSVDDVVGADFSETFVIDGVLPPGQASMNFPGEAYTATGMTTTTPPRRQESDESVDAVSSTSRSFHIVYVCFKAAKNRPAATASTFPVAGGGASDVPTAPRGGEQLAPIREMTDSVRPADSATASDHARAGAAPGTDRPQGKSLPSPSRGLSPQGPLSPSNFLSHLGSTLVPREEDYVPLLKAAGRAAMVGFHAHLAGAMYQLVGGACELTLIANDIPDACFTLQEACLSGSLYQRNEAVGAGAGRDHHGISEADRNRSSVVVDRILGLTRQTAEAISHCHSRGVLLRAITPNDVLVTPRWNALLRPNYAHAHEGRRWTTVSVHGERRDKFSLSPTRTDADDTALAAPFTNATSPDYQSPEIARIRSENEPRQRLSGRALRLSAEATSPASRGGGRQRESQQREVSPIDRWLSTSPQLTGVAEHGLGRSGKNVGDGGGQSEEQPPPVESSRSLPKTSRKILNPRRGRADSVGKRSPSLSPSPSRVADYLAPGGGGDGPLISACESDIWAWALIVFQMFSDEALPPGRGQEGLQALEGLLQRKQGVNSWTTEEVIAWLRDIELWSVKTEREIRAFKIAGPQLLVPTCRRDIVEKLGLFISDGELSCKLWESITRGLQRWRVPPRLADVLRRCLADSPDDRFSAMDEVCRLLRAIAADEAHDGGASSVSTPRADDENMASDRLRTGMILNDIGVCLCNKGRVDEAERYYKMALLSSDDVAEAFYNLGLLYITPTFNKFLEAQQAFDAATKRMVSQDPRRKASFEHSKAAERKSNYHQSQELMKALSGKYGSVSPKGPRSRGSTEGELDGPARNGRASCSATS